MHRFRCDELEGLKPGASVRLEKSENAHLFKTLRAAEGERCLLMDGRGNIGEAEVAAGRTLILRSRESAAPRNLRRFICISLRRAVRRWIRFSSSAPSSGSAGLFP